MLDGSVGQRPDAGIIRGAATAATSRDDR